MDKPTGKAHKLSSFTDLLKLTPGEMARLVPDLLTWHAMAIEVAEFAECTPAQLPPYMDWTDDGERHITHINLDLGEHGIIDLLKPETWPTSAELTCADCGTPETMLCSCPDSPMAYHPGTPERTAAIAAYKAQKGTP